MGGATSKRAKAQGQVRALDDVISDIGVGWWQVQLLYILCVASMADAMEIGLLSFLGPCVEEEMGLSSTEESTITGVVFVGETIGAFFFGELADLKGRRYSYAISLVFMAVFGVATYFAGNYAEVLAFRGLVGFGVGGCCVPFDYLAEVAPPAWRGKACLCSSLWWGFGSVLTTGSAWLLLDAYGWRVLALVCAAPVVLAMLALATLHESPRWLLAQGREPEARAALIAGARLNGKDLGEFRLAPYTVKRQHADPREIFAPGLRRSTLQLALNWVAFGFSYYGIILYIAEILEDSDSSSTSSSSDYCSFDYEPIFISSLSEPMVIVLGFLIIDRSRRVTQYLSYFLAGLFIALMAYLSSTSTATLTALAFVARGAIDLAASTTWLVTPESYPTEVRASPMQCTLLLQGWQLSLQATGFIQVYQTLSFAQ
ncbi:unnamed protein product [Heterosigma akashiwo]